MTTTIEAPIPSALHQVRAYLLRHLNLKSNDLASRFETDENGVSALFQQCKDLGLLDEFNQLTLDGAAYMRLVEGFTPVDVVAITPRYPRSLAALPPEGDQPLRPVKPWDFRRVWREVGDSEVRLRGALERLESRGLIKVTNNGYEIVEK